MRCLIFIMLFIFGGILPAQTTFQVDFGGMEDDRGYSAVEIPGQGYAVAGWTSSMGAGGNDMYLAKLDLSGNMLWERTYGSSGDERAFHVELTSDNGFIMTGYSLGDGPGATRALYVVKTDANGDTLWTGKYGGASDDTGRSIRQTADGGYIIGGEIRSAPFFDVYLLKISASGAVEWSQTFNRTLNDYGYEVQITSDGGYIITGYTQEPNGFYDVWLIKTDATGNSEWLRTFGSSVMDFALSVAQVSDGGFVVSGFSNSFSGNQMDDLYVIRTDSSGSAIWERSYGLPDEQDYGYMIRQTSDGHFVVAGATGSVIDESFDIRLTKIDSANGDFIWNNSFGTPGKFDFAYFVQETSDNGFLIAGELDRTGPDSAQVVVIKTDADGNITTTSLAPAGEAIPATFTLEQNYPNPFNPETVIRYSLSVNSSVTLKVYDIMGQEINTMAGGQQAPGSYRVNWDGRDAAGRQVDSGVYFYRLSVAGHNGTFSSQTRRMILLK